MLHKPHPFIAVLLIPTGIGATIGGYAGDGLPIARLLAQVCDGLITHPNVLNAASLYWPEPNIFYVEGYALDRFASGTWGLMPTGSNRVGLILDQGIEPDLRLRHLQVADAVRASLGVCLTDYVLTDQPLEVSLEQGPSGATWGTLRQVDSLLRAADRLLRQAQADAIAVVVRFPDDPPPAVLQAYRHSQGVDPLAGAEAMISHLIVRQFQVPCAHAPALRPLPLDAHLHPRSAAEEIGYTFLPSVLVGLSRAPRLLTQPGQGLWRSQIQALVVPGDALGSATVLGLAQSGVALITVNQNSTQMQVTAQDLGLESVAATSYLEAAGILVALKTGLGLTSVGWGGDWRSLQPLPEN